MNQNPGRKTEQLNERVSVYLYRTKPTEIEAVQFVGSTADLHAVYQWIERNTHGSFEPMGVISGKILSPPSGVSIDPRDGRMIIASKRGLVWVNVGDWIIRDISGQFYVMENSLFVQKYERVKTADE